ncbi:nucleoporin-like protein 2 [Zootermopsis nevadensis]|uniref:Nucleoporin NUP42 n=1 Tax=Zootermopsis nevadensis TaxID=136037 RepID=A0A067RB67_ZOONE|nr:nucleoporin-like protein 2 [Zootermopsis nevadensis]KDR20053.1 Nucleoporin-like 2 [Zootermopsis nevadensis]
MVICKFYQQGFCKYGSSCRFEHPHSGESVLRRRYGDNQYTTNNYFHGHGRNPGSYKAENISHDLEAMQMVFQEVIESEKGGQWPLSCFAPIGERPCFPGCEDYSPEEIRWKMYEAKQNDTLPECQRQIKELYDAAKLRRHQILNQKNEVFTIIKKLYHGEKIETEPSFSFLQAVNQVRDNNVASWTSSNFGNSENQAPVSSNFVFSLPQLGGSSGQTAVYHQSNGFYGNVQVPNGSTQTSSVFNSSSDVHSPFGTVTQDSSRLQSAVSSNSVFGGSKSILNTAATWNRVENTVEDSSLYSQKAELSQDKLDAFVAQTFTMGKVPRKPPPKDLCTL